MDSNLKRVAKPTEPFDSLLAKLETDDGLWRIVEPKSGLALWPFIRHQVLFHIQYTQKNFQAGGQKESAGLWSKVRTISYALVKNPFRLGFAKPEIVIFNSGISNTKSNSKYFNRLADHFYEAAPKNTALVEETAYGKHALPRHSGVYSHLFFRIAGKLVAFFSAPDRDVLDKLANALCDALRDRLSGYDMDPFLNSLRADFLTRFKSIYAEQRLYRVFFKVAKPRIILVEDGCYGSRAHLIFEAKRAGIITAEYQHGFINRFHLAYNFGPGVSAATIPKLFLPDYFLAYGEYWVRTLRLPSQKIIIGNPYLSAAAEKQGKTERRNVLILGSGADPQGIINIVLDLVTVFPTSEGRIIFRPHPLEWANAHATYKTLSETNVILDTGDNLYEAFGHAALVIGELSTALYEARAFGCKVFLIKNAYSESFSDKTNELFTTLDEGLRNGFNVPDTGETSADLWFPDWRKSYADFIRPFVN